MKYLLIRHANAGMSDKARLAYGKAGPPIRDIKDANITKLHQQLIKLQVDFNNEPIAVSEMLRTKQTATVAGLAILNPYAILNEIDTGDIDNTLRLMALGEVPAEAIKAANTIINNPPKERIWVTHGLLIAALQLATKTSNPNHFEPDYCEISEITF